MVEFFIFNNDLLFFNFDFILSLIQFFFFFQAIIYKGNIWNLINYKGG